MSPTRSLSPLPLWSLALACAIAACSDDTTETDTSGPPSLDIVELLANDGVVLTSYDPGDTVPMPCDGRLIVRVGSGDVSTRLENWELRPPGTCGSIENCGFVLARLLEEDGTELARGTAAAVDVPVPTVEVPAGVTYRVTAELRQGTSGEPFTVTDEETGEEVPVMAESTVTLEAATCPEPGPGLGGGPGVGGAGGVNGLGGMGGLGGAG